MAYMVVNFKTKKELKNAFRDWCIATEACRILETPSESQLKVLTMTKARLATWQPGPFGPRVKNGRASIEGPHSPAPHTWYANVEILDGHIVKIHS